MLIPVFLSMPYSEVGKTALEILGNSQSQLAYHALNSVLDTIDEDLKPAIMKNLSILKIAGIREDKSIEFYKKLLENSKPYKFCITYPDGHGNQAVIVSRINKQGKVQFVAIVIDDYKGVRDCFGFKWNFKIRMQHNYRKILQRPKSSWSRTGEILKSILIKAEKLLTIKYRMNMFVGKIY